MAVLSRYFGKRRARGDACDALNDSIVVNMYLNENIIPEKLAALCSVVLESFNGRVTTSPAPLADWTSHGIHT